MSSQRQCAAGLAVSLTPQRVSGLRTGRGRVARSLFAAESTSSRSKQGDHLAGGARKPHAGVPVRA
jgi:hypothetical protein